MSNRFSAARFNVEFVIKSFLLISGLCCVCPFGYAINESSRFAEHANLALRRTAHQLLLRNGDSTSTIPPVQQLDASTFSIAVDSLFRYEALPDILQSSLVMYGVKNAYTVSVIDCRSQHIYLGYNVLDLEQPGGVSCGGRTRVPGCYILKVSFEQVSVQEANGAAGAWWVLPLGSLLAAFGYIVWKRKTRHEDVVNLPANQVTQPDTSLTFGSSTLDMTNLLLVSAKMPHQLTYREAKLLNLFARNTNRVLERDFILKSVWEDEGIIVGRSVDVFVSRLRKMLAPDPQIKISAVHGVGYRMDVVQH
jgi:hypothetical protein